ncbi:hypothetical protein D3C81_1772950 [compost metagenome]
MFAVDNEAEVVAPFPWHRDAYGAVVAKCLDCPAIGRKLGNYRCGFTQTVPRGPATVEETLYQIRRAVDDFVSDVIRQLKINTGPCFLFRDHDEGPS